MVKDFAQTSSMNRYCMFMLFIFLVIVSYRYYQSLAMLNMKIMEVDSTKNEYSACQSSETTLREANGKFAKEVLEFQAQANDAKNKVKDLEGQVKGKDTELENLKKEVEELKQGKQTLETDKTNLENSVKTKDTEIEQLKASLSQAQANSQNKTP